MNDNPNKDVAVALNYDKSSDQAPRVIAKGHGELARRIVEVAREHGVVIESNAQLAEALSGVELDDTIPVELYQAVAEVIGFVMRVQNRMDK